MKNKNNQVEQLTLNFDLPKFTLKHYRPSDSNAVLIYGSILDKAFSYYQKNPSYKYYDAIKWVNLRYQNNDDYVKLYDSIDDAIASRQIDLIMRDISLAKK